MCCASTSKQAGPYQKANSEGVSLDDVCSPDAKGRKARDGGGFASPSPQR